MTSKLSDEQRQALTGHPKQPLPVEDPVTHTEYIILRMDVYEQMLRAAEYDFSDPDPRTFYPAFAAAVKDDLDAPGMECYDEDITPSPGSNHERPAR